MAGFPHRDGTCLPALGGRPNRRRSLVGHPQKPSSRVIAAKATIRSLDPAFPLDAGHGGRDDRSAKATFFWHSIVYKGCRQSSAGGGNPASTGDHRPTARNHLDPRRANVNALQLRCMLDGPRPTEKLPSDRISLPAPWAMDRGPSQYSIMGAIMKNRGGRTAQECAVETNAMDGIFRGPLKLNGTYLS